VFQSAQHQDYITNSYWPVAKYWRNYWTRQYWVHKWL